MATSNSNYIDNWITDSHTSKDQRNKALKALEKAKELEDTNTPPPGKMWKWVDTDIRGKKRILVDDPNYKG